MLAKSPRRLPDSWSPVSAAALNVETGLDTEARSLGGRQLPPPEATQLSRTEARCFEIVEDRILSRKQTLEDEAQAIDVAIDGLPDVAADRNIAHLGSHISNEIMRVFQIRAPVIKPTVAGERNAKAEFNAWRDAHGLNEREADYPESKPLHFGIIVVLGMVEAVLNMFMFIDASPTGVLGAYFTALSIAGGNIALAVFLGLVPLRYLNLPGRAVRLWACPALAVAGALIAFINAFAAHYREFSATSASFDEALVLSRLVSTPLDLSLQSYLLLILGLLFAVFAVHKGYHGSDPYPGYERQHRRHREMAEDLAYLKTAIHGDLEAIRQAQVVRVADLPFGTRALLEGLRQRLSKLQLNLTRAQQLDARDNGALAKAIGHYRSLNRQVRTDGATPLYFAHPVDLAHLFADSDAFAHLTPRLEHAVARHAAHERALIDLVTAQLQRIEAAQDNTERIMIAIEKSYIDETALPNLSSLRSLITSQEPSPAS